MKAVEKRRNDVGSKCVILKYVDIYSRISLSRTRLSRITAYLEVKIWSLF